MIKHIFTFSFVIIIALINLSGAQHHNYHDPGNILDDLASITTYKMAGSELFIKMNYPNDSEKTCDFEQKILRGHFGDNQQIYQRKNVPVPRTFLRSSRYLYGSLKDVRQSTIYSDSVQLKWRTPYFENISTSNEWLIDALADSAGNIYHLMSSTRLPYGNEICLTKYNSNGDELWVSRFGAPNIDHTFPAAMTLDKDNNIYIGGFTEPYISSKSDFYLLHIDNQGNHLWSTVFNSQYNYYDYLHDIAVDSNNDLIVTGRCLDSFDNFYTVSMKYQNYQLIWTEYHSINHSYLTDKGYIKSDDEANILVAHQTWENVTIQKFSPSGQLLWARDLNEIVPVTNMSIYYLTEFELDSQGNMYMTAGIKVDYRDQCKIFKLSKDGVLKWLNTLMNDQGNPMDCLPDDMHLSDQGNIYICGYKHPNLYDKPLFACKYDTLGSENWIFDEAGVVPFPEVMVISSDLNENIFIGATIRDDKNILIKINPNGNKIWQKIENKRIYPLNITNLTSGDILLSGTALEARLHKSILNKYNSEGDLTRQIRYEGPGRIYNSPHVYKPDPAGNMFAAGSTIGNDGYSNNLIVKFNRAGTIEWDNIYNYSGTGHESISDIAFDGRGNAIVTGTSGTYPHKIVVRKYNSSGEFLWQSVLYESDEISYGSMKIISDVAGNTYIAGEKKVARSDYCILVKYNPNGQFVWSRIFGDDQHDYFYYYPKYLNFDLEGNITIAGVGEYQDYNNDDYEDFGFLIKIDPTGNLRLDKKISDESGWLLPLQCESDMFDNILMACLVRSPGPGCHYVKLLKLNRFGKIQWQLLLRDDRIAHYSTEKIQTDKNGNVYLLGYGTGWGNFYLNELLKVNHQGKIIWKNDLNNYTYGLVSDTEGNCYTIFGDGMLSKYNTNGILRWSEDLSIEQPMSLGNIFIGDSAEVIIGMKSQAPWISNYSYFEVLKLKQTISDDEYARITSSATGTWINQNFPNPFNAITHFQYSIGKPGKVTIKVYNSLGQQIETVLDQYLESREYLDHWIPKNLSSGTYYIRIKSADYNKTIRVSYLK